MILHHAQHAAPLPVDAEISVAQRRIGDQGHRFGDPARVEQAAVGEVRKDQHAVVDGIRTAAVVVYPGARVELRRCEIRDAPVRRTADDDLASTFLRAALQPVEVVPVEPWFAQRPRAGHRHL
jgi:hypothetical protein